MRLNSNPDVFSTVNQYRTWGVSLFKEMGSIAPGDSGGPAYFDRLISAGVNKKTETVRFLVGLNYAVTKGQGAACTVADAGVISTFDFKSSLADPLGPPVDKWIADTQATIKPPPPPPPKTSATLPGTLHSDGIYPNVAWAKLGADALADALWDMYTWGPTGLKAFQQLSTGSMGAPTTLVSSLPLLAGTRPFLADFNGDGTKDVVALASSAGALAFSLFPGQTASVFPGVSFPSLPPPLPLPSLDLSLSPVLEVLTNDSLTGRKALLVATSGDPQQTGFTNVMFVEQIPGVPAVPLPVDLPQLVIGPNKNYRIADYDSDGLEDLIISAQGPAVMQATVTVAGPVTQDGITGFYEYSQPTIPTDCPLPFNDLQFKDLDRDGVNDFICIRPGTIEVRLGKKNAQGVVSFAAEGTLGHVLGKNDFSWFQASDPDKAELNGQPYYPWPHHAYFTDLNGDNLPDYVNAAFSQDLWIRMNLGGGRFGELERRDAPDQDANNGYALGFDVLEPEPGQTATLAYSNAYPASDPQPVPGAGSITLFKYSAHTLDKDGDGIADLLDNCPADANDDQADSDEDGYGDKCDVVPCGPDNDGDTIVDAITNFTTSSCLGQKKDNCPSIANVDQANCNAAAEMAHGAAVRGDACDPVPCPRPEVTSHTTVLLTIPNPRTIWLDGKQVAISPLVLDVEAVGLKIHTVSRHRSSSDVTGGEAEAPTVGARTSYRFCASVGDVDCSSAATLLHARMGQSTTPLRASEGAPSQSAQPWRRIRVTADSQAVNPSANASDTSAEATQYFSGQSYDRYWLPLGDINYWRGVFGSVFTGVESQPGVLGAYFEGVTAAPEWGIHPTATNPDVAADNLAIGTVEVTPKKSGIPAAVFSPSITSDFLCSGGQCAEPLGGVLWLPDDSAPYDARPRCAGSLVCTFTRPGGTMPLWRVPENPLESGLLEAGGHVVQVDGEIGPDARAILTDGTLLIPPSEPSSLIGSGTINPPIVALSSSGSDILGFLRWTGGVLDFSRDPACGRGCAARGSTLRRGLQFAYSRARGVMFMSGEESPGDGVHAIWWQDIQTLDGWRTVDALPSDRFGKIEALGWSYGEQRLWVLDTQPVTEMLRLSRIDPFGSTVEEVQRWAQCRGAVSHWLMPDLSGNMLLFSSGGRRGEHRVFELSASPEVSVRGVRRDVGTLFSAPRVDTTGYTFVDDQGVTAMPTLRHLTSLQTRPGQWSDLAECF